MEEQILSTTEITTCEKCGEKLSSSQMFCPTCGHKRKNKPKKKRILVIILCTVLSISIAYGIFLIVNYSKNANENKYVAGEWIATGVIDSSTSRRMELTMDNAILKLDKNGSGHLIFVGDDGTVRDSKIKYTYRDTRASSGLNIRTYLVREGARFLMYDIDKDQINLTTGPYADEAYIWVYERKQ